MAVTSKTTNAAPLDRAMLDSAASPTRAIFGIIFLAWSWVSTVIILGRLLAPALSGAAIGVPDSYLVAFVVAILVSWVEFVSAGRWKGVYWVVLLLFDAPFTAGQTHTWLSAFAAPYTDLTTGIDSVLWIIALVGGIIAAIFGEVLLFGRRR